jgi:hypothetical protein
MTIMLAIHRSNANNQPSNEVLNIMSFLLVRFKIKNLQSQFAVPHFPWLHNSQEMATLVDTGRRMSLRVRQYLAILWSIADRWYSDEQSIDIALSCRFQAE